jgi:hypothetical protein
MDIQVDTSGLEQFENDLLHIKNGFAIACQGAISATLTTYRKRISQRIGEQVRLSAKDIKATIGVKRPSLRNLVGSISLTRDKPVWLIQYLTTRQKSSLLAKFLTRPKSKRSRPPLSVQVRKQSSLPRYPVNVPKAFVGVMPSSSYIGIFQRVGVKRKMKSGRYAGKTREVNRRLQGPSPLRVFQNAVGENAATLLQETTRGMAETLMKNMLSKVDFLLSGKTNQKLEALQEVPLAGDE